MYSRDYLDDYDPSSTYIDTATLIGVERKEPEEIIEKNSSRAERRKNEWKYALKRKNIYNLRHGTENSEWSRKRDKKPLHYYAKNSPWNGYAFQPNKTNNKGSRRYISKNYRPVKNWSPYDKRQIDNLETQLEELYDE